MYSGLLGTVAASLVALYVAASVDDVAEEAEERKSPYETYVLVFGGNGLLGSPTTKLLVDARYNVTVVNRGNRYYDSGKTVFPNVVSLVCDRKLPLSKCSDAALLRDRFWDFVIDFSGYTGSDVNNSLSFLSDRVGLYVYISTDSVYDVCDKEHGGLSRETDAVRPTAEDDRARLQQVHGYAHGKLEGEEAVMAQRTAGGFPFVTLRLPDVVGPRDTTLRWWIYQLWLRVSVELPRRPVTVPHFLADYRMSVVYSRDVAGVIAKLLTSGPQLRDQAVNLAYEDHITLEQILRDIADALSISPEIRIGDSNWPDDVPQVYLYPTNRRGPLDVSKATSLLDWKPTPWSDVVAETVEFYERAMGDPEFATQRDEVIQMTQGHVFKQDAVEFYRAVERIYKIDLHDFIRDEL